MVETTDYLIVGFIGNPLEVGFEKGKSPPDELYFDFLAIDKSGNLYVQRSEFPLFKLLYPEYDNDDVFNEPTRIGKINDEDFYGVLNGETLTREEIYDAFVGHTKLSQDDGLPYIISTFVTEGEFLDFSRTVANGCYKLSKSGLLKVENKVFMLESRKIKKMMDNLEENDEMNHVYLIIPVESPITDQVAEIYQRMFQQQDLS